MASIHARLLPAAVAILVCACSANAWSGGQIIHVCRLNSWIVQTADPLLRLSDYYDRDLCASSVGRRLDAAGACRLRRERRKWLDDCWGITETRCSNSGQHQFWDSVLFLCGRFCDSYRQVKPL
ncbi:hypothetical protein J3E72DRAFT_273730 [Bipolaris maydis]|nr:hypothetical protein J3E72DRAFT_273730 [Bipolaris maydis]